MSQEYIEILLDGATIRENVTSLRIARRRTQATDTCTLKLADFSLYSLFDFGVVPLTTRLHVGTSTGTPKLDGSTVSTNIFTSASSDFTAEGVTTDDIIFIINSSVAADLGGHEITVVGTTTLTSSFTFGTASSIEFIILKNQGRFFVEKPDVVESKEEIAIPSLWGRNNLARLTDPFVSKLTKTYNNKRNFSDIVAELVDDHGMDSSKIIIDIDDFIVPGNLLTVSNQFPLQVIINLALKTNGYVRSQKTGDLHVKKDSFHFSGLPIAQTLGDDDIRIWQERTSFPEFGNRILVRSVTPEAAQDVRISLSLETNCLRGDGKTTINAKAVVTDIRGNPIANGTKVTWSVTDSSLFTVPLTVVTADELQMGEEKRSSSLLTVSTDFPIRDVIGVYRKMDFQRIENFFPGGTFIGRTITLGADLPFSDTLVVVDYVASGIANNVVRSVAGAPEGGTAFVSSAVGRIRDTAELCIRNTRNIFLTMDSDPSEINVCLPGSQTSSITAKVRDNGTTGQLIGINWQLIGVGTLSNIFTMVRNTNIDSEIQTSRNIFTVGTKFEIASVVGVWRADDGKSGTNHFTNLQHRSSGFTEREITLGTNLPFQKERLIIEYTAKGISRIQYVSPSEDQEAPSVVQVVARIDDGTAEGIAESEEILLTFRCPDGEGVIPGQGTNGLPSNRVKEPDCSKSGLAAKACDIGSPDLNNFTECVCGILLSGAACPTDEDECRDMCQSDYNQNGFSSMLCETESVDLFCKRETQNRSLAAIQECFTEHEAATVDKCVEQCLNHKEGELSISPADPVVDCATEGSVQVNAVGGAPPYSWSIAAPEGNPTIEVGGEGNTFATILAQPNASTLPDNFLAYKQSSFIVGCGHAGSPSSNAHPQVANVCGRACGPSAAHPGGFLFCSTILPATNITQIFHQSSTGCNPPDVCTNHLGHCESPVPASCPPASDVSPGFKTIDCGIVSELNLVIGSNAVKLIGEVGGIDDLRTPGDIAAGCVPCHLAMDGAVVTVTDALGNEAMVTLSAIN